ncbi:unnamed protein product [Rotaria sordida]|uniref:TRAF3-interacting protein 1 n=1 Tax=Rotaria sordida TaxID=392033 RepID=A0A813N6D4_9BILA|nr:unnamed protein product [Rotaria sordida]CAF0788528.1 unnamed protein product [Rotaria sordida]CAF3496153.1 unnamed protein product [Rotaria sordida]CAF3706194.1 unnamed protein product [Rotaria sordida]
MSEAPVDSDIIKRTQDTLGQIINAPALTDKLLNRPPVQFLQDIVKAVIKKTNFLQGLYSDEELSVAYLKEGRDSKTLFMKKLVTAVYIAVKRPPDVRVSKILAGQEADKTNLLLQALAEAIHSHVDNNEVVRKTLQSLGETNENEEPPPRSRDRKDHEQSEKHRSKEERSSKSHEREESTSEKKTSSRDSMKDQNDADGSNHTKRRRSVRPSDDNVNDEKRLAAAQRQEDDDENDKKDEDDSRTRRSRRPSSAKGPRKQQNTGSQQQRPTSPKPDSSSRQPTAQPTPMSTDRDNTDERPLVRPGTANTAAKSRKPMKVAASDEISGSSGRVPSAAQRGQGTLIIESKGSRDNDMHNDNDDDDANFLIQEEKPSLTKSFRQDDLDNRGGGIGDHDDEEGDEHGALVKKMIDSKKQLEHGSEIAGQRSDVKTIAQNDAQRRREREKIQKDVDKLRETIQSLTKSVVPLGKILEYLQEDYEMMAKEMQHYSDEYKRTVIELRKEKFTTDQNLEPLRAALLDVDEQIIDMKNRIIFMKKKINNNEKANASRLLDIIRKTK